MTDTYEHRDEDQSPEPANDRMLADLRSLPKVSAPLDFQYHLRERIAEIEAAAALPWWKRFFKPSREGGYAIPGYAYGAVATVAILAVSVYVYRASYVEETFRNEQMPPAEHIQSEEATDATEPVEVMKDAPDASTRPAPAMQSPAQTPSAERPTVKREASRQAPSPSPTPPPPAVAPLPAGREPVRKQSVRKEDDAIEANEWKFRTRGFDYDPEFSSPQDDTLRALDSLRRIRLDRKPSNDPDRR